MTSIKLHDIRIREIKPLISPALLQHELPVPHATALVVQQARADLAASIEGTDPRLLVIVGPCSIHDPVAALEYAEKLVTLRQAVRDKLYIVMRVYFEKPRTIIGWKGLINDPHLNGSHDINDGLRVARKLLLEINALGMPAATEFLDTITPQYIADLISWGAIGARTTESQVHRNLASGLSMPIGFKNSTNGDTEVAINAILSAQSSHCFLSVMDNGLSAIVDTAGNPYCHIILRGGSSGPNYSRQYVQAVKENLIAKNLLTKVMIDCSHGNSEKDYRRQAEVLNDVCQQLQNDDHNILGVMIESNLQAGRQDLIDGKSLEYGQSITDACIDWSTTEKLIHQLADSVRIA